MMIFVWILLIVALFYIFGDHKNVNIQSQGTSAEEVLKMRYVKGEIDEDTFEKMKKTII